MATHNNDLKKAMTGAMKSMGLPQAKDKTVNAVSKFNNTKPKAPLGSMNPYQLTGSMVNGQ